eukprot:gene31224-6374_t
MGHLSSPLSSLSMGHLSSPLSSLSMGHVSSPLSSLSMGHLSSPLSSLSMGHLRGPPFKLIHGPPAPFKVTGGHLRGPLSSLSMGHLRGPLSSLSMGHLRGPPFKLIHSGGPLRGHLPSIRAKDKKASLSTDVINVGSSPGEEDEFEGLSIEPLKPSPVLSSTAANKPVAAWRVKLHRARRRVFLIVLTILRLRRGTRHPKRLPHIDDLGFLIPVTLGIDVIPKFSAEQKHYRDTCDKAELIEVALEGCVHQLGMLLASAPQLDMDAAVQIQQYMLGDDAWEDSKGLPHSHLSSHTDGPKQASAPPQQRRSTSKPTDPYMAHTPFQRPAFGGAALGPMSEARRKRMSTGDGPPLSYSLSAPRHSPTNTEVSEQVRAQKILLLRMSHSYNSSARQTDSTAAHPSLMPSLSDLGTPRRYGEAIPKPHLARRRHTLSGTIKDTEYFKFTDEGCGSAPVTPLTSSTGRLAGERSEPTKLGATEGSSSRSSHSQVSCDAHAVLKTLGFTSDAPSNMNSSDATHSMLHSDAPSSMTHRDTTRSMPCSDAPSSMTHRDTTRSMTSSDAPRRMNCGDAPSMSRSDTTTSMIRSDAPRGINRSDAPSMFHSDAYISMPCSDTTTSMTRSDAPRGINRSDAPSMFHSDAHISMTCSNATSMTHSDTTNSMSHSGTTNSMSHSGTTRSMPCSDAHISMPCSNATSSAPVSTVSSTSANMSFLSSFSPRGMKKSTLPKNEKMKKMKKSTLHDSSRLHQGTSAFQRPVSSGIAPAGALMGKSKTKEPKVERDDETQDGESVAATMLTLQSHESGQQLPLSLLGSILAQTDQLNHLLQSELNQLLQSEVSMHQQHYYLVALLAYSWQLILSLLGSLLSQTDQLNQLLQSKTSKLASSSRLLTMYANRCNSRWTSKQSWSAPDVTPLSEVLGWMNSGVSDVNKADAARKLNLGEVGIQLFCNEDRFSMPDGSYVDLWQSDPWDLGEPGIQLFCIKNHFSMPGGSYVDLWQSDPWDLVEAARPGIMPLTDRLKGVPPGCRIIFRAMQSIKEAVGGTALSRLNLLLHLHEGQEADAVKNICVHDFFGLKPENIIFLIQRRHPGYRFNEDMATFAPDCTHGQAGRIPGSGLGMSQMFWPAEAFTETGCTSN